MKKLRKIITMFAVAAFLTSAAHVASAQGDKKSTAILDAMSSKYQKIKSFKANFTYTPEGGKPLKGEVTTKGRKTDGHLYQGNQ
jgi:outer membrane lipoprotein-sorting protein